MKRVYTGGTFDLFHRGHVNLLRECYDIAHGGQVIVSLNGDEFIKAYKGRPPVMPYEERAAVLEACRYVDKVILNVGGRDSRPAIERAKPDIIVVGDDWQGRDYMSQLGVTKEWLESHDIKVRYVPYTKGISSTEIRARMKDEVFRWLESETDVD
jgi:glycerol-3-phosphate cytidylyltransferase